MSVNSRIIRMFLAFLIILGGKLAFGEPPDSLSPRKAKIIQWGGIPPLYFIKDNIKEMEKLPFEGLILSLQSNDGKIDASWNVWTPVALKEADFSKGVETLKAIKFKRFKDNFLPVDVTPGRIDWFDDNFSTVIANAGLIGKIVKEGRLKGIMFDIEQYEGHPFEYKSQVQKDKHTIAEYQAKVRERGRQFMKALITNCPNIVVLTTFGYDISGGDNLEDRAGRMYGMYAFFLDGMLDACTWRNKIYDGYEFAYGLKTAKEYANAQGYMMGIGHQRTGSLPAYLKHYRSSFGIWTDNGRHWDPVDFNKNYFTAEEFGYALHHALKNSDGYVWVYSEASRWWNWQGLQNVPQPYIDAVVNARKPHPNAPPVRNVAP